MATHFISEKACDTCKSCRTACDDDTCLRYRPDGHMERAYMPLVGGCVGYEPTLWTLIKEWAEGWR